MKSWRSPFMTLLALVAMFATMLPQTIWACPMTGRVGSAAMVCANFAAPLRAATPLSTDKPCAHMGGKCCKPLSVPPSQSDDPHQNYAVVAEKAVPVVVLAPASQPTPPVLFVAPFQIEPVARRVTRVPFAQPPPSFWIQHRPITCAGRAPPVL